MMLVEVKQRKLARTLLEIDSRRDDNSFEQLIKSVQKSGIQQIAARFILCCLTRSFSHVVTAISSTYDNRNMNFT